MIIPNKFSLSEFINVNSNQILTTNSNAKNAIELILQKVLKCNRIDLYTKTDLTPNKKQFQIISTYMNRLKKGEPIQYILNQAFFYGHSFFVDSNVLIPRFDTELIIEILKEHKKCQKYMKDHGLGFTENPMFRASKKKKKRKSKKKKRSKRSKRSW